MGQVPERIEEGLIAMTAIEVVGLLRTGEVSSLDLLDALEPVGALPTPCIDPGARPRAKALSARPVEERGLLCGLPVPITPGRWPCPSSGTGD